MLKRTRTYQLSNLGYWYGKMRKIAMAEHAAYGLRLKRGVTST